MTVVNGVQPRSFNSPEYASANGANGPVINTLQTLVAGLATVSSFSENKKGDDRQHRWRYADLYAAISPICEDFLTEVGITRTSAYSWLCRRRHNHDLRHTFGTLAVQVFPLSDVKAFMGHADIATTMIYVHYVPQLDAADRLSRALRAAAGIESTSATDALLEGAARA